jgi:predicted ATPase
MIHLRTVSLKGAPPQAGFPFTVPVIRTLDDIDFTSDVTFFVGENGSGKSTLLEALAVAARMITVGSDEAGRDYTLNTVRPLADALHLTWNKRTRRGFFMRSEDFFGYVKHLGQTRETLKRDLQQVDEDYQGRSRMAQDLARSPYMRELHALQSSYGDNLDAYSHGESYFTLFKARFVPGGLYLLDEPEAPLSPMRQLALLSMLKLMVDQDAQFIIATHSPIIMAYPGATILSFDEGAVKPVAYEELEHVVITRTFLNNPEAYLQHLISGDE